MSTFVIPMMFFQCLTWPTHDGETIRGFRFEQPVTIVANDRVVKIADSVFVMSYGCFAVDARDHALVTPSGITWRGHR